MLTKHLTRDLKGNTRRADAKRTRELRSLKLADRVRNALCRSQLTLHDVLTLSREDLLQVDGLGVAAVQEILSMRKSRSE